MEKKCLRDLGPAPPPRGRNGGGGGEQAGEVGQGGRGYQPGLGPDPQIGVHPRGLEEKGEGRNQVEWTKLAEKIRESHGSCPKVMQI